MQEIDERIQALRGEQRKFSNRMGDALCLTETMKSTMDREPPVLSQGKLTLLLTAGGTLRGVVEVRKHSEPMFEYRRGRS